MDGHQVTAVGEVPPVTLEAIAAGVTKDEAHRPRRPPRRRCRRRQPNSRIIIPAGRRRLPNDGR